MLWPCQTDGERTRPWRVPSVAARSSALARAASSSSALLSACFFLAPPPLFLPSAGHALRLMSACIILLPNQLVLEHSPRWPPHTSGSAQGSLPAPSSRRPKVRLAASSTAGLASALCFCFFVGEAVGCCAAPSPLGSLTPSTQVTNSLGLHRHSDSTEV